MTNKGFVQIAPHTFVSSWDDVKSGHLSTAGITLFNIYMKDGGYYQVKGDDIPLTLELWKSRSQPFSGVDGELPADVAQWVGVIPEGGKRIPRGR
jgi:hypothetical protein